MAGEKTVSDIQHSGTEKIPAFKSDTTRLKELWKCGHKEEATRLAWRIADSCETWADIVPLLPAGFVTEFMPGDARSITEPINKSIYADRCRTRLAEHLVSRWQAEKTRDAVQQATRLVATALTNNLQAIGVSYTLEQARRELRREVLRPYLAGVD